MTVVKKDDTTKKRGNEEEKDIVDCEEGSSCSDLDKSGSNNSDHDKKNDEEESKSSSLEQEEMTEDCSSNNNNQLVPGESPDDEEVFVNVVSELSCPSSDDSASDPAEGTRPTPDDDAGARNSTNKKGHIVTQLPPPPLSLTTSQQRGQNKKMIVIKMVLLIVLVVLMIIVPLVVRNSKQGSNKTPTLEELFQKRDQETEEVRINATAMIPGITNKTLYNIMWKSYGPQRQAYEKIVMKDPLWDTYNDWRKQQRYAMACLFYQFFRFYRSDFNAITISPILHECQWMDDKNRVVATCNSLQQVVIIDWIGKKWVDGRWSQRTIPYEISFLSNLRTLDCSEGIFWVGDPTDDFIDRTWNDDEAYNEGLSRFTHPGLELVFPYVDGNNSHGDFDYLAMPNNSNNWTLPSLEELRVENCFGLEGMMIPSTVGLLTSLTKLDLSLNELSSKVPSQISFLTSLTSLNLHSNNLVGTLPEEMGDLSRLKVLNVKENYLDEYLPSGFCRGERIPLWSQLVTDWCWVPDHCCA